MLPAMIASLTEPPESNSFHSISVSGKRLLEPALVLDDQVAVRDRW